MGVGAFESKMAGTEAHEESGWRGLKLLTADMMAVAVCGILKGHLWWWSSQPPVYHGEASVYISHVLPVWFPLHILAVLADLKE
jgi:hypothetical protein